MSDDNAQNQGGKPDGGAGDGSDRVAFLEAEAKKAFAARDELKKKLRDLETQTMSAEDREEYQRLKAEATKLAEDRKRAEGRFDELRTELVTKHQKELADRETRLQSLETELVEGELERAFYAASALFGDAGETILTPDMALPYFRRYVEVVKTDDGRRRVVVKDGEGRTIHGADGNPAPFTKALREVIDTLPNKDRILRGSGKTGSGSSGGSNVSSPGVVDPTRPMSASQLADPKARAAFKRAQASAGGLQMGRAWERTGS